MLPIQELLGDLTGSVKGSEGIMRLKCPWTATRAYEHVVIWINRQSNLLVVKLYLV